MGQIHTHTKMFVFCKYQIFNIFFCSRDVGSVIPMEFDSYRVFDVSFMENNVSLGICDVHKKSIRQFVLKEKVL